MIRGVAVQVPPRFAGRSVLFQGRDALAQLPNLAPQLSNFLAQFSYGPDRIGELSSLVGARRQESTLALVTHCQAVRRQLPNGSACNGHCDLVRLLELGERGELSRVGELASRDASAQVIGHLLIGELAGPLDHLHPKSRHGLCLIVPKPQR